jgi:methylenetetrahydrofolate dehydrogenase (NADP+) / methenyltetrahydrofolate cyclohydrolase
MIIDGNDIAAEIRERLRRDIGNLHRPPLLFVFLGGNDPVSLRYIERKRLFAEAIGADLVLKQFPADISETAVHESLRQVAEDPRVDGMLVQLPLPAGFDAGGILSAVPPLKDVDALSSDPVIPSPVIGAIAHILKRFDVALFGKRVAVVGRGKVVGIPAATWAAGEGALVDSIDKDTLDALSILRAADIIILGAGSPGFLVPDMVREGAVIIDAGTSEVSGSLRGDADPACAEKAALFTPVPGGVGPLTVAMLFSNLVELFKRRL